ncbi:Trafficking protein particle complex subunit 13 [Coemansia sp. RSA 1290]|nr:Trafficking protein particle complex subunit 13 [Coemansia sp. RSA 1290]
MSLMREAHPLTLKVMRLSRPVLAETQPLLPLDSSESVLAQPLREAEQSRPTARGQIFSDLQLPDTRHPLDTFPLTETLVLPRSFGTMFLGETFLAQMCICNESSMVVRDVSVKVVVLTGPQQQQQQQPLLDTSGSAQQLAAGQPLNLQITHEIKELGMHILGCTISYLSAQGEHKTLQRSFRFQAANPLVVKTKVNHLKRDVLLEVQVHNATPSPLVLERMRFDPASPFAVQDLNEVDGNKALLWGDSGGLMQPGDVRQYLYRLQPPAVTKDTTVEQERAVQYATALGKLDILWRGAFGSVGRLQTSQLLRKSPGMFLIEVEQAALLDRDTVSIEQPFVAQARIRNVSERKMAVSATVHTHKHPLMMPCGPVRHDLGELDVGQVRELELEFLPLAAGVQRFGAMAFCDSISGYTRELDYLLDVFVE